jgi:hypothetical protein
MPSGAAKYPGRIPRLERTKNPSPIRTLPSAPVSHRVSQKGSRACPGFARHHRRLGIGGLPPHLIPKVTLSYHYFLCPGNLLHSKGQKRQIPSPLNGNSQLPLVVGTIAGYPARQYLPTLRDVAPETTGILIIYLHFVNAETAHLAFLATTFFTHPQPCLLPYGLKLLKWHFVVKLAFLPAGFHST